MAKESLPAGFLGLWHPYSRAMDDVGIQFTKEGRLIYIENPKFLCCHHKNNSKIYVTKEYKIIHVSNDNEIYVLTKEKYKDKNFYEYVHYTIEKNPDNKILYLMEITKDLPGCHDALTEEWESFDAARLWTKIGPDSRCGAEAERRGSTFSR